MQIRGVSEEVRQVLAERAEARGQSLQAFLLWLVEEEAHRSRNRALLERFKGRNDGSRMSADQAVEEIAQLRREREAELVEGPDSASSGTY